MVCLTCSADPAALVVVDTSVIINLNAAGRARQILASLPNQIVAVDLIPSELAKGRLRGWQDADLFAELVNAGVIEIVKLGDAAGQYFESLVMGSAAMTLDDGEAATIAYALDVNGIAVIDERKANRICEERFPKLRLGSTVDILAHPSVEQSLGKEALANAVFMALYHGRMRVFPHHVDWVVGLIGPVQAALCTSLPNSVRVMTLSFSDNS